MANNRREFIKRVGISSPVVALSGCGTDTNKTYRRLTVSRIDIQSTNESDNWSADIQVEADIFGEFYSSDEPAFEDVVLIGYDNNRDRLCRREIGNIPSSSVHFTKTVSLECSKRPYALSFETRESFCRSDTDIEWSKYEDGVWDLGFKDRFCE